MTSAYADDDPEVVGPSRRGGAKSVICQHLLYDAAVIDQPNSLMCRKITRHDSGISKITPKFTESHVWAHTGLRCGSHKIMIN